LQKKPEEWFENDNEMEKYFPIADMAGEIHIHFVARK
jgi:hypothetical protein